LAEGRVNQFRFDGEGALWAAAAGGLSRLKDGRIATLTSRNGLPCDAVQWTMEDDLQSVWLGMPCGLARVARTELEAWAANRKRTIQTTLFDGSDGARMTAGVGGFTPRVSKSPDGKLCPTPGQRLPPLVRELQIDYTALSLVAPEKNRFKYKLEGYDRDWHDAGNRRQAYYTNLDPRRYRFRVQASNNDGVWNEAGESPDFSIDPKFYQTYWFKAACGAVLLTVLWGGYRLRLLYLTRQFNLRLEARVNERTRIARDLHDTLLQSFQGVLLKFSTIKYMIHVRPEEAEQALERTIEQARAAITEGRDAVQGLRSSTIVPNDLAPEFRLYVEGKSKDLPPLVRDEVYQIASETLRNAFRHAQARRIEAQIRYDPRQFRLHIVDNGKGIDPAVLSAGGRAGHHGLPGLHERAQLAGGKLSVWSQLNSGTEIELTIPAAIAYTKSQPARQSIFSAKGTAL
jgi:hypothetical protein